jgi:hypothetical protein
MKHWSNFLFNEWYFCWYLDWRSIEVTFYLWSDISWSIEVTFYLTSDISWSIEVTFIYWVIFLEAMKWLLFIKWYFLKHRNDIIYRVIFLEGWSIEVTFYLSSDSSGSIEVTLFIKWTVIFLEASKWLFFKEWYLFTYQVIFLESLNEVTFYFSSDISWIVEWSDFLFFKWYFLKHWSDFLFFKWYFLNHWMKWLFIFQVIFPETLKWLNLSSDISWRLEVFLLISVLKHWSYWYFFFI